MVDTYDRIAGVPGDLDTPLSEHFKELSHRMMIVLIALFGIMIVLYPFSENVLMRLWDNFIPQGVGMFVYSPLEWVIAKLKLSLVVSIAFVFPLFLYEMFKFASRGLYSNEKKFFVTIVPSSFILFFFGAYISYYLVLPFMFDYVIFYSNGVAISQISVQTVMSSVTTLILGFGLIFQLPLIMIAAIKMGIVEYEFLRKKRIFVYMTLLGLSVFISPDPTFIAQSISAFAFVILFEMGLLLARWV
ncbi:twin-arginine translocase subunit TatC [Methanolobus sp. WCC4]|uniref:twin-arginine translocase subunit TatC n=1 Tax=Methanolobus sp. WCC4 TaxID=3125784 RepID=UPI0030F74A56